MDLKSVSGFTLYVENVEKSADFYESLGFKREKSEKDNVQIRLNWFTIDLVGQNNQDKAEFKKEAAGLKGAGIFINVSVSDVDEFYKKVVDKGFKPLSEPRDTLWGTREFVIRDPDSYKLVMFKRQKPRNPAE